MKQKFSAKWKSSKKPRKQRKYLANAPLHLRKKFLSVNLSKDLRKKYQTRNIPARKGDTVKILRGKFKGKKGKIARTFIKQSKVTVEKIQVQKQDGSKVEVKLEPSNLQITELNLEDRKRKIGNKQKSKTTKQKKQKTEKREEKKTKKKEKSKKKSEEENKKGKKENAGTKSKKKTSEQENKKERKKSSGELNKKRAKK